MGNFQIPEPQLTIVPVARRNRKLEIEDVLSNQRPPKALRY